MRVQTFISPTRNFISSNADFRFLGKLSPVWVRLESYLEERERCRQSPSSYFFLNTHFPHHTFSSIYFFSSYFLLNTFSHHTFPIILFLNILFLIIHFPFHNIYVLSNILSLHFLLSKLLSLYSPSLWIWNQTYLWIVLLSKIKN